jgi:hypothetical protein
MARIARVIAEGMPHHIQQFSVKLKRVILQERCEKKKTFFRNVNKSIKSVNLSQ